MSTRRFALIFGIVYTAVGVLGFFPVFLAQPPADAPIPVVTLLYGYLIGLFPVNILHTLVHLAVGVWGIAAWRSMGGSVAYARSLAVIFAVLAVMGLFPGLNTVFGLVPLHGHDIWLHAGTAAIAAYFGWSAKAARGERTERRSGVERRVHSTTVARDRRTLSGDRRRGYAATAVGAR